MSREIVYSVLLILLGLIITWGVIDDWKNCSRPETRCYYFLLIPGQFLMIIEKIKGKYCGKRRNFRFLLLYKLDNNN